MPDSIPDLVLASQSPRRRQILEALGIRFRIEPSSATESKAKSSDVDTIVTANALAKARDSQAQSSTPEALFLGADTLVVLGAEVLGKPTEVAQAERMLKSLSGKTHEVITGIALVSSRHGERCAAVRTPIRFRTLSDREIQDYLKTPEPLDKAGAYAVQGLAALFVESIEGSYTNVMGLPLERFLTELESLTGIPLWRWIPS